MKYKICVAILFTVLMDQTLCMDADFVMEMARKDRDAAMAKGLMYETAEMEADALQAWENFHRRKGTIQEVRDSSLGVVGWAKQTWLRSIKIGDKVLAKGQLGIVYMDYRINDIQEVEVGFPDGSLKDFAIDEITPEGVLSSGDKVEAKFGSKWPAAFYGPRIFLRTDEDDADEAHAHAEGAHVTSAASGEEHTAYQEGLLQEIQIPKDGNCLFAAISRSIHAGHVGHEEGHEAIRKGAVDFIKQNRERFCEVVDVDDESFDEYISRMQRPGQWGGHPEMEASVDRYNICIELYSFKAADRKRLGLDSTNIETPYRRFGAENSHNGIVRLHYVNGNHYNAIIKNEGMNAETVAGVWVEVTTSFTESWGDTFSEGDQMCITDIDEDGDAILRGGNFFVSRGNFDKLRVIDEPKQAQAQPIGVDAEEELPELLAALKIQTATPQATAAAEPQTAAAAVELQAAAAAEPPAEQYKAKQLQIWPSWNRKVGHTTCEE